MECVILWRNTSRGSDGGVGYISKDSPNEDEIEVFASIDEALKLAEKHTLLQHFPYQIVELDEL